MKKNEVTLTLFTKKIVLVLIWMRYGRVIITAELQQIGAVITTQLHKVI